MVALLAFGALILGVPDGREGHVLDFMEKSAARALSPQQQQQQAQQQAQQAAAELQSPCDLPQQPSSLLVVGEELCADSIKDVARNAPAQATPHPQCTASTRADKVSS